MEDIAAAAGVSAATAYNHFSSKHALVGHVFGPLVRPFIAAAERDIAVDRPVVESLIDHVRDLTHTCLHNRRLTASFWSAVQEYTIRVDGPADPGDEVDPRTLAPVPEPLRVLIAHGQLTGQLRRYPPADDIARIAVNLMLLRSTSKPDEPPEDVAELLLIVTFGMVRPELLVGGGDDSRPFRR